MSLRIKDFESTHGFFKIRYKPEQGYEDIIILPKHLFFKAFPLEETESKVNFQFFVQKYEEGTIIGLKQVNKFMNKKHSVNFTQNEFDYVGKKSIFKTPELWSANITLFHDYDYLW